MKKARQNSKRLSLKKFSEKKSKAVDKKALSPARTAGVSAITNNISRETTQTVSIGIHNLRPAKGARRRRKLLGRGSSSGHGKTSTRGSKGQTSRAGRDFYLGFEGGQTPLIRKIPKRGFVSRFKREYQIVNLNDLNKIEEAAITLALLEEKGLIKDKDKLVKILGEGEIKNPITIQAHAVSKKASEKIKNVGGKIELVSEEIAQPSKQNSLSSET